MIRVNSLTKRYGDKVALNALTLDVPDGSVFGLLGPNGSGKSTLLRLLMRFTFPDAGGIDLGGLAPAQIGYTPDRIFLPPRATVQEYLWTCGRLSGMQGGELEAAVARRLDQVGLRDSARLRISACSKGMSQRVQIAGALIHNPPLVLLDEPTAGLDPAWQKWLRDLITALHAEGKTVLVSTHRLAEVSEVCTHIGILKQGHLVQTGTLANVLRPRAQVTIRVDRLPDELRASLAALHPEVQVDTNVVTLTGEAERYKPRVLRLLLASGADIESLTQQRSSLEQVYLEAMRQ